MSARECEIYHICTSDKLLISMFWGVNLMITAMTRETGASFWTCSHTWDSSGW